MIHAWPRLRPSLVAACALVGLLVAAHAGCVGYQIGASTLYPGDVRSVSVPVFESTSFRRGLGERLTEAVVKQIELKTPYKVISGARADSVLAGRVLGDTKKITAESPTDEPREVEIDLKVEVTWTTRRGEILREYAVPIDPDTALILQSGYLIPEVGGSIVTGQQQAIERLAVEIVSLMEVEWFGIHD